MPSSKTPFFSKANLRRIREKAQALIPIEIKLKPVKEVIDIFQVSGIGFLEDFVVYSRIPAKHWHNASPGERKLTTVSPITIQNMIYGTMSSNLVTGTTIYVSSNTTSASTIGNAGSYTAIVQGSDVNDPPDLNAVATLPEATQAIEAKALPEHALLTPKAVYHELERMPTPFTLLDMEHKIKLYKSMGGLVRHGGGGGIANTLKDVIVRLEARVKYRNSKEVRAFFDQFQNTNDDRIQALLEKYDHLRIGPADDFIPEMPEDALELMVEYTKRVHEITDRKAVFYLIARDSDFKRKKECRGKRDPILLAQSPFGFYWQVLGAWDEEMLLLDEI